MTDHERLASLLGYASIACWIVVFTPQYYKNYNDKNTDGVSIPFLLCWILGDLFSLIGAFLGNLMITVLLLALYYFCADTFLMGQVLYYRYIYNRQDEIVYDAISSSSSNQQTSNINDKERLPLLTAATATTNTVVMDEQDKNYPTESTRQSVRIFIIFGIFLWLFILLGSACFFFWPWTTDKIDLEQWHVISQVCGCTSALLYCVSRIPQIMKNFRNESVEGLSLIMFVFCLAGNLTFCMSILLKTTNRTSLLINFPWLLGSGGTLFFDLTIFFQFYIYRKSSTLEV